MDNVQSWSDTFVSSLQNLWSMTIAYTPLILGALLVLIIGIFLSSLLAKFAKKLFEFTRLDTLSAKLGLRQEMEKLGLSFGFADMIAWVVKWFFILATLIAVVEILRIPQVGGFLENIALYIPNVLVAVLLLAVGLVAGRFLETLIHGALTTAAMPGASSTFLASLAKWAVYVFSFLAALLQLGIAETLLQTLFTGFIFMIALAGGLSFGLGGRDAASRVIDWIGQELTGKRNKS